MFAITFLDLSTFKIKIIGVKDTEQSARLFLYTQAKDYVLQKDGERNMVIVSPEEIANCPIVLGHFLCEIEQDCLDLYYKEQVVYSGMLSTSVSSKTKKVGRYQISEIASGGESLDDFVNDSGFTKVSDKKPVVVSHTHADKEVRMKFDNVISELVNSDFKKSLKSVKKD